MTLLALLAACGGGGEDPVLRVTDLNPRQVEVGDTIEVSGQNFPAASDIRRLSVTLRGTLARPGRAPCAGPVDVTLSDPPPGAVTFDAATGQARDLTYAESAARTIRLEGATRLSFTVTEALLAQLSRCPSAASDVAIDTPHATLLLGGVASRGATHGVTVRVEGLTGQRAVTGTLRGAVLDLHAPPARRVALEAGARARAERTLDFTGIALAQSHPTEGGLRVATVRAGSPADVAGIASNDVIARFDGLTVFSVNDLVPAPGARQVSVAVLRGEVLEERVVSLEGLVPRAPVDLVATTVLTGLLAVLLACLLGPRAALVAWGRAVVGRAARAHPVAGGGSPLAFARWLLRRVADVARGVADPERSRGAGAGVEGASLAQATWRVAPHLVFAAVATTIVAVPFAHALVGTTADVGVAFTLAMLVRMVVVALAAWYGAAAGGASGLRRAAQFLPCSAPATVAVACAVATCGTPRIQGLVAAQGAWPWQWLAFRHPGMLLVVALFALAVVGTGGDEAPRPASGEARIAERLRVACAFGDWASVVVLSAAGAAVFLGAWLVPGAEHAEQEASVVLQMLGAVLFMVKTWGVAFAVLWLRWALPALRVGAAAAAAWRELAGLSLLACGATGAWIALSPRVTPLAQAAVAVATFALGAVAVMSASLRRAARARSGAVDSTRPFVFG